MQQLVNDKKAKAEAEIAKVSIRNMRRTAVEDAKKLEKEGVSEDEIKTLHMVLAELRQEIRQKEESARQDRLRLEAS